MTVRQLGIKKFRQFVMHEIERERI